MDKTWLAKAQQALAAAPPTPARDMFHAHDGSTSDLNLHTGDMLAEPDVESDPFRRATRVYE
jgi:hypothetical protein